MRFRSARCRALAVDLAPSHRVAPMLRWPTPRRTTTSEYRVVHHPGPAGAVIRSLTPLPDGRVGVGTDQGAFFFDGRFSDFPYPGGARRSRVEAAAIADGRWVLASTEAMFVYPLDGGAVTSRRLPSDGDDGRDDVRAMLGADRLYIGWRCRFEGGDGPPEALSLTRDPDGVVWAGTVHGELYTIDGGKVRSFGTPKGRPVRHLTFALGQLHVAAAGAHWRFDGVSWRSEAGEPTALAADAAGRLWSVLDGAVFVEDGRRRRQIETQLTRPWSIAGTTRGAWVGGPGMLVEIQCE
jgi:hypothetical protein